jgi:hypothetical protein
MLDSLPETPARNSNTLPSSYFDTTPTQYPETYVGPIRERTEDEILAATALKARCEADFREKWNAVSRQRKQEGKPASFRGANRNHLTLLAITTESPVMPQAAEIQTPETIHDIGVAVLQASAES